MTTIIRYTVEVETTTDRSYQLEETFRSPRFAASFLQAAAERGDFLPTINDSYISARVVASFTCCERQIEAK